MPAKAPATATADATASAPVAPLAVVPSPSPVSIAAASVADFAKQAGAVFLQRANVIRCLLLAFVSPVPVNVLLDGPPGTAKTRLVRAVAHAFAVGLFSRALSRWTDDAALLGPPDLKALADGRLERVGAGYMTDPAIGAVFLDELHRKGKGIGDLLLSSLSDRETPDCTPVPAHVIVAATNQRLVDEDDQALADRFALRVGVPRVTGDDLRSVIGMAVPVGSGATVRPPVSVKLPVLPAGTLDTLRAAAADVVMPADVLTSLHKVAERLRTSPAEGERHPDVSERRLIVATRILQASAVLAGRDRVDFADLVDTLPFVLDDGPDTTAAIHRAIATAIPQWLAALTDVRKACDAAVALARRIEIDAAPVSPAETAQHSKREQTLTALRDGMQEHGADAYAAASDLVRDALNTCDDVVTEGVNARRARR